MVNDESNWNEIVLDALRLEKNRQNSDTQYRVLVHLTECILKHMSFYNEDYFVKLILLKTSKEAQQVSFIFHGHFQWRSYLISF